MGWAACGHAPAYKPAYETPEYINSPVHSLYAYAVDSPTDSLTYGAPIAMKGSTEMNDPLYQMGRGEVTAEQCYDTICSNLTKLLQDYQ